MQSLTLVTPPAQDAVTLSEVKAWARIDDTTDDPLIQQLIGSATVAAERYTRRSFITQTWKLTLDLTPNSAYSYLGDGVYDLPVSAFYGGLPESIKLPNEPLQAITSVTTYDLTNASSTFSSSNYYADTSGGRLVLTYGATWPSNLRVRQSCDILYTCGYGDNATSIPQPIKTAIMIHAASLYEQRGQCEDAMDLPPGSKQLLNQYRILGSSRG